MDLVTQWLFDLILHKQKCQESISELLEYVLHGSSIEISRRNMACTCVTQPFGRCRFVEVAKQPSNYPLSKCSPGPLSNPWPGRSLLQVALQDLNASKSQEKWWCSSHFLLPLPKRIQGWSANSLQIPLPGEVEARGEQKHTQQPRPSRSDAHKAVKRAWKPASFESHWLGDFWMSGFSKAVRLMTRDLQPISLYINPGWLKVEQICMQPPRDEPLQLICLWKFCPKKPESWIALQPLSNGSSHDFNIFQLPESSQNLCWPLRHRVW